MQRAESGNSRSDTRRQMDGRDMYVRIHYRATFQPLPGEWSVNAPGESVSQPSITTV